LKLSAPGFVLCDAVERDAVIEGIARGLLIEYNSLEGRGISSCFST
jgi:hypothetical protein